MSQQKYDVETIAKGLHKKDRDDLKVKVFLLLAFLGVVFVGNAVFRAFN